MKFDHQALVELLISYPHEQITVVGVRNELAKKIQPASCDAAALRRWINNRFVAYTQSGWLTKTELSKRKSYYTRTSLFYEDHSKPGEMTTETDVYAQLTCELETHRRTVICQMSEIEEYRRLKEHYPALDLVITERFENAVEANYKLIGRMKALESILTQHQKAPEL